MKKLLSLTLALLMVFSAVLPNLAYALENDAPEETEELMIEDIKTLNESKLELDKIKAKANTIQTKLEYEEKMLNDFNNETEKLSQNLEATIDDAQGFGAGMAFAQIYDLSSIPQRLMLIGRLAVAMRFATTALRYKVDQAHTEMAEYVFQGLLIAVSPFHSIDDMKNHMLEFEALKAKLIDYPDLTVNDTANLYVRADLDKKLHKARFLYLYDLKDAPSYVLEELSQVVREVTHTRLEPQRTVSEIYDAEAKLDAAVGKALMQVIDDKRATKTEYQDLREHRRLLISARRQGDRRKTIGDLIDSSYGLLMDSRASSRKVQETIDTIRLVLDLGPRI